MGQMRELAIEERPRERLCREGPKSLSDSELLALLLGSGSRGRDVFSLAARVIEKVDRSNSELTVRDLMQISGLGLAKAAIVVAALEFSRRRICSDGVKIREAKDVIPLLAHLFDRKQETFVSVSLNGAHEVIASRIVTIGLVNVCQVHPREVFAEPLKDRACAIIVAHNHPSGDLTPSKEDWLVTERLKDGAKLLGITLLDHIIFSSKGFRSMLREI